MKVKALLLSLSLFFTLGQLLAQAPAAKQMTHADSLSAVDTVIINHNIYKRENNWFLFGPGFNTNNFHRKDGSLGFDYQFTYKQIYWQVGIMRGGEYNGSFISGFYNREFNEIHAALGLKKEHRKTLMALYLGIGGIQGNYFDPPGAQYGENFTRPGFYGSAQIIYKPIYDVGFGLNTFADVNVSYSVYGVRLILFLSNAYKGKKWF